jgi:choline kinase
LPLKFRTTPKCLIKINNRNLLERNFDFYKKFNNKYIVTGFKYKKILPFIKKNNFINFVNYDFKNTGMVYSLFKVKLVNKESVVICYTDIVFDKNIYENLLPEKNIIVLKKNWINLWEGRMNYKNIIKDAEDVEVKNKQLISIGNKIQKKFPKYQYMGIIKLISKDFFILKKFYKKINNKKIDMTSFLNKAINEKILKFQVSTTKKYWYEIDSSKDIKFTKKKLW